MGISVLEGLNMRQIDPERLNPRKAGKSYFFYGSNDHEVFYITNEDKVVFFQINYHGFIVEMKLNGPRTFENCREHSDSILCKNKGLFTLPTPL